MQLAIGSYAYRWAIGIGDAVGPTRLTPAGMVERAARLGVKLVQIADNLPLHRQPEGELAALERAMAVHGVRLELGFGSISMESVRRYLELAARFSAPLMRVAPDASDAAHSAEGLVETLRRIDEQLSRHNVRLAIENHFHLPSPRLRDIVAEVASPNIGVCLDVANSIAVGEWPEETLRLLLPHAINLHLKNYRIALDPYGVGIGFVGAPLGQGRIDVADVLRQVAAHRRDITVVYEQWAPRGRNFAESCEIEERWLAESLVTARHITDQIDGEQQ